MSGETGAPVGDQSGIPHSQCGAQVGAWHGYGCPQAREADDTDPSPHRHTLILEVRSIPLFPPQVAVPWTVPVTSPPTPPPISPSPPPEGESLSPGPQNPGHTLPTHRLGHHLFPF